MKNSLNKIALILTGIFLVSLTDAKTITVSVLNSGFSPSSFTATIGDTVKWVWVAGAHTTTATSIPLGAVTWDNPINASNTVFEYIITTPGTYNYWCSVHTSMMEGSFTVTPASVQPLANTTNAFALVYPNPITQVLNVHLRNYHYSSDLVIRDVVGNEVDRETFTGMDNSIDLTKWEKGVYFYRLNSGAEAINGKFEVQ
jgi:plastocyanin